MQLVKRHKSESVEPTAEGELALPSCLPSWRPIRSMLSRVGFAFQRQSLGLLFDANCMSAYLPLLGATSEPKLVYGAFLPLIDRLPRISAGTRGRRAGLSSIN